MFGSRRAVSGVTNVCRGCCPSRGRSFFPTPPIEEGKGRQRFVRWSCRNGWVVIVDEQRGVSVPVSTLTSRSDSGRSAVGVSVSDRCYRHTGRLVRGGVVVRGVADVCLPHCVVETSRGEERSILNNYKKSTLKRRRLVFRNCRTVDSLLWKRCSTTILKMPTD